MEVRRETVDGPNGSFELLTLFGVEPFDNNVYVLRDPASRQCLVIDASEAGPIFEATAGFHVQTLLITHGHRDHIADLPTLRERIPAPVGVGEDDQGMLQAPAELTLADNQEIAFGRHALRAIATPGHTPGSTCFLVDHLLFSGDTLFPGGPGNTNKSTNPYGDFPTIIDSVRSRLFTLPDETRVLPGHGEPTTIGQERPHLEEWIARGW